MARKKKPQLVRPCTRCGRLIRPNTWKAEDAPGTLIHGGFGMCSTCYTHTHRDQPGGNRTHNRLTTAENDQALESYLNRRRERLAKLDRIVAPRRMVNQ